MKGTDKAKVRNIIFPVLLIFVGFFVGWFSHLVIQYGIIALFKNVQGQFDYAILWTAIGAIGTIASIIIGFAIAKTSLKKTLDTQLKQLLMQLTADRKYIDRPFFIIGSITIEEVTLEPAEYNVYGEFLPQKSTEQNKQFLHNENEWKTFTHDESPQVCDIMLNNVGDGMAVGVHYIIEPHCGMISGERSYIQKGEAFEIPFLVDTNEFGSDYGYIMDLIYHNTLGAEYHQSIMATVTQSKTECGLEIIVNDATTQI